MAAADRRRRKALAPSRGARPRAAASRCLSHGLSLPAAFAASEPFTAAPRAGTCSCPRRCGTTWLMSGASTWPSARTLSLPGWRTQPLPTRSPRPARAWPIWRCACAHKPLPTNHWQTQRPGAPRWLPVLALVAPMNDDAVCRGGVCRSTWTLLCSDFGFTVGWWIEAARKLGNTAAEKLSLEW